MVSLLCYAAAIVAAFYGDLEAAPLWIIAAALSNSDNRSSRK